MQIRYATDIVPIIVAYSRANLFMPVKYNATYFITVVNAYM